MTPEEAKAHVAKDKAELAALDAEVGRLAGLHPGPVFLAMMRAMLEIVLASQGNLASFYRRKFYEGVLMMLRSKGIQ